YRFEVIDLLASANTSEHIFFFRPSVVWNDEENVLADRLGLRVSEQPLCAVIPRRNDAVHRLAHDGVVGGLDNRRQPRAQLVALLPPRDIAGHLGCADDASISILDRRYRQ